MISFREKKKASSQKPTQTKDHCERKNTHFKKKKFFPSTFQKMIRECDLCHKPCLVKEIALLKARNSLHDVSELMPIGHKLWIEEYHKQVKTLLQSFDDHKENSFRCDSCDDDLSTDVVICPYPWSSLNLKTLAKLNEEDVKEYSHKEPLLFAFLDKDSPTVEVQISFQTKKEATAKKINPKKRKDKPKEEKRKPSPPPSFKKTKSSSSPKSGSIPLCKCKMEAVEKQVSKQGVNQGKFFYACPNYPNSCGFFQWSNKERGEIPDFKSQAKKKPQGKSDVPFREEEAEEEKGSDNNEVVVPVCKCQQRAVEKQVSKKGPTRGKFFFACPNYPNSCGFFQWSSKEKEKNSESRSKKNRSTVGYEKFPDIKVEELSKSAICQLFSGF